VHALIFVTKSCTNLHSASLVHSEAVRVAPIASQPGVIILMSWSFNSLSHSVNAPVPNSAYLAISFYFASVVILFDRHCFVVNLYASQSPFLKLPDKVVHVSVALTRCTHSPTRHETSIRYIDKCIL
jgi:hypothetical protein